MSLRSGLKGAKCRSLSTCFDKVGYKVVIIL
eukprot:UN08941